MNSEQLKEIAEKFKASLSIEELDELERQYNQMYQKLKSEQSSSIEKKDQVVINIYTEYNNDK